MGVDNPDSSAWTAAVETLPLITVIRQQARRARIDGKPLYPLRKLQLVSIAACQRLVPVMRNPDFVQILEILERYTDKAASDDEWEIAQSLYYELVSIFPFNSELENERNHSSLEWKSYQICHTVVGAFGYAFGLKSYPTDYIYMTLRQIFRAFREAQHIDRLQIRPSEIKYLPAPIRDFLNHFQASGWQAVRDPAEEERYHCDLIRDVFQHPERPVTIEPTWLTANVVALAQTIYDQKQFHLMPILGDALQDASCENETILQHCQHPVHVRGCWLLDLLLGKS